MIWMPETLPAVLTPDPTALMAQRWVDGESIQALALEVGISRQGLYKRIQRWSLSGEADKAYKSLVRDALVNRIAEADEKLDSAETPVDIARAREQAKFARWDAERRLPAIFGLKQQDTNDKVIVIVNREKSMGMGMGEVASQPQVIEIAKSVESE
jgi:hypothetical protein